MIIVDQSSSTLVSNYQLTPNQVGTGATLTVESEERTSKPSRHRSLRHLGAAVHAVQLFSENAGMFHYTFVQHSTHPSDLKNWFRSKFLEKKQQVWPSRLGYTLRIEEPRSDAAVNVFTVAETANQSRWSFVKSSAFPVTDDLAGPISLQSRFMAEFVAKKKDSLRIDQAYEIRIEELRSYAEVDGLTMNESSENDFWSFIMSLPFAGEAELVLLDNGNLRAIWDDDNGNHFGLQFLGDRELQYVIFRHRNGRRKISRAAGRDSFDGVKLQIQTFDLETLLHI